MKDCTGHEIALGDRVVHAMTASSTITLCHGIVTSVSEDRVDYDVIDGNDWNQTKTTGYCKTPHNIIYVGPFGNFKSEIFPLRKDEITF